MNIITKKKRPIAKAKRVYYQLVPKHRKQFAALKLAFSMMANAVHLKGEVLSISSRPLNGFKGGGWFAHAPVPDLPPITVEDKRRMIMEAHIAAVQRTVDVLNKFAKTFK